MTPPRVSRAGPPSRVGLVFHDKNPGAARQVQLVAQWLRDRGLQVLFEEGCARGALTEIQTLPLEELVRAVDLIITVGGDGTLLRAARDAAAAKTPLLGINRGTVGFLTELSSRGFRAGLESLLAGEYEVESRLMLEVQVHRGGKIQGRYQGLNDAVVKRDISRILRYQVALNGRELDSFPADGVIVSTPTGSTAYSLSTGGPIVKPDLKVLLICPICPHRFYARSFIVDASDRVDLIFQGHGHGRSGDPDGIYLTVDGQTTVILEPTDQISIKRSRHQTRLIRLPGTDFFQVLRSKLR